LSDQTTVLLKMQGRVDEARGTYSAGADGTATEPEAYSQAIPALEQYLHEG
jgi:hypothetical protein